VSKDKVETDIEGRLHDGYAYSVTMTNGQVTRLCDHDDIRSVWARIRQAQAKNEDVWFSGARDAATDREGKVTVGRVDGTGVLPAKSIERIANYGTSAAGISEIRFSQIEAALTEVGQAVDAIREDVDGVIDDLKAKSILRAEDWPEDEEGEGDEGLEAPNPGDIPPETKGAVEAAIPWRIRPNFSATSAFSRE